MKKRKAAARSSRRAEPGKGFSPAVSKSTRHSKITGDFAEHLVLYWLSKYGFECAHLDHTGIDLIARNPGTTDIMGISVKSRSRSPGTESTPISSPRDNYAKARKACEAFGCVPYFAIVADTAEVIRVFLMPMDHLLKIAPERKTGSHWRMTSAALAEYRDDPKIKCFEFHSKTSRWW